MCTYPVLLIAYLYGSHCFHHAGPPVRTRAQSQCYTSVCPAILHTSKILERANIPKFVPNVSSVETLFLPLSWPRFHPLIWQFRIGKVSLEARTRKFCGRKKLLRHGREGGGWWPWGWGPEPAVAVVKLKNVLGFLPLSQLEKIGQELRHLCHDQIDRSRDSCCPLLRTL